MSYKNLNNNNSPLLNSKEKFRSSLEKKIFKIQNIFLTFTQHTIYHCALFFLVTFKLMSQRSSHSQHHQTINLNYFKTNSYKLKQY